jgi:endogenous inhibitor of DNA gyrase (YacG/DUF329 family)
MPRPKGSKNKIIKRLEKKCRNCGKIFEVYPSRSKRLFCSYKRGIKV